MHGSSLTDGRGFTRKVLALGPQIVAFSAPSPARVRPNCDDALRPTRCPRPGSVRMPRGADSLSAKASGHIHAPSGNGEAMTKTSVQRREFMALIGGAAAWPRAACAQQGRPRLGVLLVGG